MVVLNIIKIDKYIKDKIILIKDKQINSIFFLFPLSSSDWFWCWELRLEWNYIIKQLHFLFLVFDWCKGNFLKCNLDTLTILSTGFQVDDFWVLLQKLLDLSFLDFTFCFLVDFVSHQDEWELFGFLGRPLVQKLIYPRFNVFEGLELREEIPFC